MTFMIELTQRECDVVRAALRLWQHTNGGLEVPDIHELSAIHVLAARDIVAFDESGWLDEAYITTLSRKFEDD